MEKHSAIEAASAAMTEDNERIAGTKARIAATERCNQRFSAFLNRSSSLAERASRAALVEDSIRQVVADICNEYRYDNPAKLAEEMMAHLKSACFCKGCGDTSCKCSGGDDCSCGGSDEPTDEDDSKEASVKIARSCPKCGSDETYYTDDDAAGQEGPSEMECEECGKVWTPSDDSKESAYLMPNDGKLVGDWAKKEGPEEAPSGSTCAECGEHNDGSQCVCKSCQQNPDVQKKYHQDGPRDASTKTAGEDEARSLLGDVIMKHNTPEHVIGIVAGASVELRRDPAGRTITRMSCSEHPEAGTPMSPLCPHATALEWASQREPRNSSTRTANPDTGYQSETIDLGAASDTEGTTTGLGEPSPKMDERQVGEVGDNLYGLDDMDVPESTRNQKTHMDADQKEPEFTSDARETGKSHPDVAKTVDAEKNIGDEQVGPATETFSNPSNTADPVTSSVAAKWGVLEDPSA